MNYRVVLSRLAVVDLEQAYQWAAVHAPLTSEAWLSRFRAALATLGNHPERCALAQENRRVTIEIRELLFGSRPNVYRVVFSIEQSSVRVLRIRRAQRRNLSRRQIEEAGHDE